MCVLAIKTPVIMFIKMAIPVNRKVNDQLCYAGGLLSKEVAARASVAVWTA